VNGLHFPAAIPLDMLAVSSFALQRSPTALFLSTGPADLPADSTLPVELSFHKGILRKPRSDPYRTTVPYEATDPNLVVHQTVAAYLRKLAGHVFSNNESMVVTEGPELLKQCRFERGVGGCSGH
jgi:hypothetical protein